MIDAEAYTKTGIELHKVMGFLMVYVIVCWVLPILWAIVVLTGDPWRWITYFKSVLVTHIVLLSIFIGIGGIVLMVN
jgi:hypothetical protein